jgi:flagellar biosynthesis/type III secretory pathway M-ring protein FliF/YscJ
MLLQTQIDWSRIGQIWGPLGIIAVVFLILIVAGAKWFKSTMEGTLADARRERDAARIANEQQASRFLESLTKRDEIMEKGFDEILHEIRNNHPRRK